MPDRDSSGDAPQCEPGLLAAPRWLSAIAAILGVLLLAAAGYMIATHGDDLARCFQAARTAPAWLVGAIAVLPLVNWAITSLIFWTLTRRFAPVGYREMCMLIGSAWLLNMLPFKPGLVGRVAYHKAMSGISIADSLMVTATAMLTGAIGIAITVGTHVAIDASLGRVRTLQSLLPLLGIAIAALLLAGVWLRVTRAVRHRSLGGGRATVIAIGLRILDTYIWSLRYFLAFELLGLDQSFGACVVIAGVSQFAGQVPVQFGVREWSVGVTTSVLNRGGDVGGSRAVVGGLTVDLVCRASEILCALPVGLISTWAVYRHIRRKRGV